MENIKKPTPKIKPKKKSKVKVMTAGDKRGNCRKVQVQEGVECYLTPKTILYCKNFVYNGGNKAKAARDSGLSNNFPHSKYLKNHKYIPMYIEKLKTDLIVTGEDEEITSDSYVDHIKSNVGKLVVKRYADIINCRADRIYSWGPDGIILFDSESLSPEDAAAIETVSVEKTEFLGRNPRTTTKMSVKLYSPLVAMEKLTSLLGINFSKDQDAAYAAEQLKDMLVKQKAAGILPSAPTPETDPTLLMTTEEDQDSMSNVTKH